MATPHYLIRLDHTQPPESAGSKALNLYRLMKNGFRIPPTLVCLWDAYYAYLANDARLSDILRAELCTSLSPQKSYAIRSSANIEDNRNYSFAGQFKTVLNVQGVENILQAMSSVWSSANTPAVQSYLERREIPVSQLSMAVLIQEMVSPIFSGVALSKNPVTGSDEIIVEAVRGDGTQLVQTGITPYRWVNKMGYWVERADNCDAPITLVEQIVSETKMVACRLHQAVDLEWVYDGKLLYWVQVREITTLNQRNVYSNYIPREMLPGMIKPLIFSVNIPLVNSVWIDWIGEITGDLNIQPEDLAKSFYYRVYFNMGMLGNIFQGLGLPRESVEMLMGSLPRGAMRHSIKPSMKTFSRLPWLVAFILDKWSFATRMKHALPELEKEIKALPFRDLEEWNESELIQAIDQHKILMHQVAYYNVLGPLLMGMYNNVLKTLLAKLEVEFNSFDLTEGMPNIEEYYPATHLRRLNTQFRSFDGATQDKIRAANFDELILMQSLGNFPQQCALLLEHFGHLSDNGNDFSAVPWREQPSLVLKLVIDFEPNQQTTAQKIRYADLKIPFTQRGLFKFFYRRAREFRLLREQISRLYTLGYGLFRYYYLALGNHFVRRGLFDAPEDIFYLTDNQVHQLVAESTSQSNPRPVIGQHKADMERYKNILLPTVIYGDEQPPIKDASMRVLAGVPTSIGHYTGRVKVVLGLQDLPKVKQGDVLVIPYSDVGWTPLFAHAGAVVAESGGLLSHSSIVAREYNIPAVVSVEGATRLADETLVTVDGHKGEVLIHSHNELDSQ